MDVAQALLKRQSVRAFLPQVPPADLVRKLIEDAGLSASGGNMQPWRVVALAGEPLAEVVALAAHTPPEGDEHNPSYPPNLWEPYRSRRFANGEDLYRSLDIPRDNKVARLEQLAKNGQFFGAPVGLLVYTEERMNRAQWLDLGIYLQSLMLLAVENGLATCAQGYWRRHALALARHHQMPEGYHVAVGLALGYADESASINQWRATRAPFGEWAQLRGF
ncbi:MAG: nitroreductase [Burkholderiaceae bacterium]|nr:nitroreductase [Burkholderiaceae bacterium]